MTSPAQDSVYFLLVDDLEENLQALDALLRRNDRVMLKARSGPAALELLLKYDVALALVDVQMPTMDGFELAELIRGTERTRRVPIIFLTAGTADLQRRFRGYEAGAVDFIQKPIESDVLKSKAEVFSELYRQRQEVTRQRDELRAATEVNARLLAESRRYAEALRENDRRKDEFLAMLAHELRNPLSPIRNAVGILHTEGAIAPEQTWARDVIDRQVQQLTRLVDDLLDVARVSRGTISLRRERVELASVISDAVIAARPLIDQHAHLLEVSLPENPVYLDADPTRLSQVLMNLLNNAAKYMKNGGRIWLTAERQATDVVIRVRDTGIGIPSEKLSHIFEVFMQLDNSLERAQGGLGIGLTLVKRLVELHEGSIEAHSEGLDRGAEFRVRLPALPEEVAAPAPEAPEPQPPVKRRILVVDDVRDSATSLAMLLRLLGSEVTTAGDGLEALESVAQFHPDVVLMDIGLPKMNGYEVARRIREDYGDRMLLVAVTGWGQEEDRSRSKAAGFDYHVTKPVEIQNLQSLLAEGVSVKGGRDN